MKKYIIIITISAHLLVKSQIPNPATDPNFYLDTRYSDEFNGTTLNTSIWRIDQEVWNKDSVNEILSTNRTDNVDVHDGRLYLKSSDIPYLGHHYTQGYIESKIYPTMGCYFETYSKIAHSRYEYPGFWTYDGSEDTGVSCTYREIDIMEYTGNPQSSTSNLHFCKDGHRTGTVSGYEIGDRNIYHKYGCLWESRNIEMVLDEKVIKEQYTIYTLNQPMKLVMHEAIDFYLILNIDPGIDPPSFPLIYTTEYVRVYRLHCDVANEVVEIPNFSTFYYAVKKSISLSGATTVPSSSTISLRANDFIELYPGFEVPNGTDFSLNINGCN
jgi:hypothetical protein